MSPGAGLASVMNMSAPIQSHHASAPDQPDTVVPPRVPWTAVVVFIVMACGLAWLVAGKKRGRDITWRLEHLWMWGWPLYFV